MIDDPDKRDELVGISSKVNSLGIYAHTLMSPGRCVSLDQRRNQEHPFNRRKPPQGPCPQVRFTEPTRCHDHQALYCCHEVKGRIGIEPSSSRSLALPNRQT